MPRRQRFIEESILPRLYRQAPVNSIWDGSGNVQCLDLLRAASRDLKTVDALHAELYQAHGLDADYDTHCARLRDALAQPVSLPQQSRRITEDMALALQASILLRSETPSVGEAFCHVRLGAPRTLLFGSLPAGMGTAALVSRATMKPRS